MPRRVANTHGFTLVELLVVIAIIALLIGIMLPALAGARQSARTVQCASNQRQLVTAWHMYAGDANDRAMPLAYWSVQDVGSSQQVFWWGTHGTSVEPPAYDAGFIAPYLADSLRDGSVFECPAQPWGTYRPQGPSRTVTSTYGYNGYYLSPSKTPGWAYSIEHRPWQRVSNIRRPTELMVFADTLMPAYGNGTPRNNALLDPPLLFSRSGGGKWSKNQSPTTAFRHKRGRSGAGGSTVTALADGHVESISADPAWLTHPEQAVGSVGGATTNGPRYVPDWDRWRAP